MNDADRKLCEAVADMWQSGGGDAEGFTWCWHKVYDILKEREEAAKERGAE